MGAEPVLSIVLFVILAAVVRAYRREHSRAERGQRRAQSMERVARDLSAAGDPLEVLESIPASAMEVIEADYAALLVLRGDEAEAVAVAGAASGLVGTRHSSAEGLAGEVLAAGRTIALADYQTYPRAIDRARRSGIRAAVGLPIFVGGSMAACLIGARMTLRPFQPDEIEALEALAAHSSLALSNSQYVERLRDLYLASIRALAAAVDARDPYTRGHAARVSALARAIAEELGLPRDEIRRVQLGALLHDIGKIGIPDAILNKPGPLHEDEWTIMRTHPALGASILESVEPLADLAPIVRDHHERYDGGGYPDGRYGEGVDRGAYITAVADAFEVIVSKRSYKEARTVAFAIAEITRERGRQFHPVVADAARRLILRDSETGGTLVARVRAIDTEQIEDVPGPQDALARYAASAQTHARRLAILQRLATEIAAVLDMDVLAPRLLRIVCDAMGYEDGFLTTLDDAGQLVVRAGFGASQQYVGTRLPRGAGISSWVVEQGRLQNVADVRADPRYYGPPEVRSSLIVPLRVEDRVVGILGIESLRVAAFGGEDEQLLTTVSHQIAAALRVAELHQVMRHAAETDPLTGLLNRRALFERLAEAVANGQELAVAVIDVDGLKHVNDRQGHQGGDEALVKVGQVLASTVRAQDVVARTGGDEFVVLFTGASVFAANNVMSRVNAALAEARLSGAEACPTVSWGLAQATGAASADEVVYMADRAMSSRKRRRRALA